LEGYDSTIKKGVEIMAQQVFERQEKKYVLTKTQYLTLEKVLEEYMNKDDYGLHCINSLYFDTDDFKLIRASQSKPSVYKEKLRLRSYGTPTQDAAVYIELKKKYKGTTFKRRIQIKYKEAWQYLNYGIKPREKSQVFNEIDYFIYSYHTRPKVLIMYDRIALFGKEDKEFRITFDFNVRFRDYNLDISKGSYGTPILKEDTCLMEVKTLKSMPCWFCSILSDLEIYPRSFSKYGNVYNDYLLNQEELRYAE